eukprot:3426063-Rhodomonas_salina.2
MKPMRFDAHQLPRQRVDGARKVDGCGAAAHFAVDWMPIRCFHHQRRSMRLIGVQRCLPLLISLVTLRYGADKMPISTRCKQCPQRTNLCILFFRKHICWLICAMAKLATIVFAPGEH